MVKILSIILMVLFLSGCGDEQTEEESPFDCTTCGVNALCNDEQTACVCTEGYSGENCTACAPDYIRYNNQCIFPCQGMTCGSHLGVNCGQCGEDQFCTGDHLCTTIKDGMVTIPEGDFMMGCDETRSEDCNELKLPYYKVYLDRYRIDLYEVTVAQFKECVDAGACRSEHFGDHSVLEFHNYGDEDRLNHPMNSIAWLGAEEYCTWAGKRLPTEAEWEKAARGTDGRLYPWGDQLASCDYAVMNNSEFGCGAGSTWAVGKKPAGRSFYGLYDMGGNVWEWVNDRYAEGYDTSITNNPRGPETGDRRVQRGGSWGILVPTQISTFYRHHNNTDGIFTGSGFRCASSE